MKQNKRTKLFRRLLPLMLALLLPQVASAYDFMANGIAYNIVSSANKTIEVTSKTSSSAGSDGTTNYSGNVVIGETVYYSGISYTVIGIGEQAFKNSFISTLKLPETLTYIKKEAFTTCFSLSELSIPASVTEIGASCFWMCPDLQKVYSYATTPPTCTGSNAFSYMQYNDATLYVPYGCLSLYKYAYGWKDFPNFMEMAPMIDGHEYVDLQLPSGKLWATKNYGASSVSDYGTYVEWSSNDVVNNSWGSSWKTPTIDDIKELINNCSWSWSNVDGKQGYTVKGNNGNSIFLPAAGVKMGSVMKVGEWCYYWSSTQQSSEMVYILLSTASSVWYGTLNTMANLPIRPVADNPSPEILATGITLNKSELSLEVGGSETLVATVTPSNVTNSNVTWSSSNTRVVSVSANGVVTANAAGSAVITAHTTDGTNLSAICNVTVIDATEVETKTVQVGYGTETNEVSPVCNWWKSTYSGNECLYVKEDIGMKKGDKIVSLSYYCQSGSASGGNFNVRIKNTSLSSFKSNSDMEDVSVIEVGYDNQVNGNTTLGSYSSGDWITFDLSEPFIYNGENIIIDIRNTAPATRQGWCYFASTRYGARRGIAWRYAKSEDVETDGFQIDYYSDDYGVFPGNADDETVIANVLITYIPAETTTEIIGDVNNDGEINIADVNAVIDAILGGDTCQSVDVNNDGEVNIADVNTIIDLILSGTE